MSKYQKCSKCKGKGTREEWFCFMPMDGSHMEIVKCYHCLGYGKVMREPELKFGWR